MKRVVALLVLVLAAPLVASAEEPKAPESWFQAAAEYRVDTTFIDPMELGGTAVRDAMWTEQRLRTDVAVRRGGVAELHFQADLLGGVLFGDNGTFGRDPEPNSGIAVASKRPNTTSWQVGLPPGGDPLDPDAYVPVLRGVDALVVNHAYADVFLPVGLLRLGRQPLAYGANLTAHDGSRINRWGMSRFSDSVDRALFATKLDQIYGAITQGAAHVPDPSPDRGLALAVFHDWISQRDVGDAGDDARQVGMALQWRRTSADWFCAEWSELFASAAAIRFTDDGFDTDAWGFPFKARARIGPFTGEAQLMLLSGETREVSEGFATLTGADPRLQAVSAAGAQLLLDWDFGRATVTLEFDYASGDDDPRPQTDLTSFAFARDLNVGLLLFEHVLAFESARSAAVGEENLAALGARSFPLTEIATDGRFTNAIAIFPQAMVRVIDRPGQSLHVRGGALFAWPAESGGVVDPIMTILRYDGAEIADDAVNFHGGRPGSYYGTELDLQVEWRFRDRFLWTLESALLLPGSSLENEHGLAVAAFLVDNRFTVLF